MYSIEFTPSARRDIKKLPKSIQMMIDEDIRQLAENPRLLGVKKLIQKKETYRIRFRKYRILYQIQDERLLILVIRILPRDKAYKK